mmetsp:Transcript_18645/g.42921  ORF Transcript_18645/g.42921 Transcript_18645/m.42921 type:complete len:91 (+) Transcript_18645:1579-1851(+)
MKCDDLPLARFPEFLSRPVSTAHKKKENEGKNSTSIATHFLPSIFVYLPYHNQPANQPTKSLDGFVPRESKCTETLLSCLFLPYIATTTE